jgi:hypothetical protein
MEGPVLGGQTRRVDAVIRTVMTCCVARRNTNSTLSDRLDVCNRQGKALEELTYVFGCFVLS